MYLGTNQPIKKRQVEASSSERGVSRVRRSPRPKGEYVNKYRSHGFVLIRFRAVEWRLTERALSWWSTLWRIRSIIASYSWGSDRDSAAWRKRTIRSLGWAFRTQMRTRKGQLFSALKSVHYSWKARFQMIHVTEPRQPNKNRVTNNRI